jgi:Regulator of ribonuclease activity B
MPPTSYEYILAKHLAMNRQTWAVLLRHGVTEQSKLRLDFSYSTRSRQAAEGLRSLLEEQTDYELRVESDGSFLRRRWRVEGTTQKTAISPKILDQWVIWMVNVGRECSCEFDGWGTSG